MCCDGTSDGRERLDLVVEIYVEIPTLRSLQFSSKNWVTLRLIIRKTLIDKSSSFLIVQVGDELNCVFGGRCTSCRFQSKSWSLEVRGRETVKGRNDVEECDEIIE